VIAGKLKHGKQCFSGRVSVCEKTFFRRKE
jgi:hypothetical protein